MLRTLAFALVLLPALISCSSSDSDPEPTSDQPRYTANQVQRAILDYGKKNDVRAYCSGSMVKYKGDGMWTCGSWTFDERNGTIFH